ncbi:hypothetical protein AC249_AIPGENE24142 [Exaiptasia diaphana]|nr:hypothetical protein AC249_AIPGENE24142 [Exaiptasia diaphana]
MKTLALVFEPLSNKLIEEAPNKRIEAPNKRIEAPNKRTGPDSSFSLNLTLRLELQMPKALTNLTTEDYAGKQRIVCDI